jgi:glycosyltransferase involved in cell wall biosynthesis
LSAVVAVVPAYEAAASIADVVRRARLIVPDVFVVDDGSRDETAAAARAAGAEVVRHERNRGKGAALATAFALLLPRPVSAVVTLDADGQHDPNEIPRFLEAFAASNAALIVGQRKFRQMPPLRRLSNTVGGLVLSAAVGGSIPDNQSGYRLVDRRLMSALLGSTEDGFAFEVEMIARCIALRLPLLWVPIRTIYAGEPSHIRPLAHVRSFFSAARDARRIVRGG